MMQTRTTKVIAIVAGVTVMLIAGAVSAGEPITALLDPYFRIQSQLTADKMDGIGADAGQLAEAAAKLGGDGDPIAAAARELAATTSLPSARDAFSKLSDAVIAYADRTRAPVDADVATMYCPMVKKSWMQKGQQVRNPYLGRSMANCGEQKKKRGA
jgi:Cu(I)/Ag(I) efflux system membrane fusion protein